MFIAVCYCPGLFSTVSNTISSGCLSTKEKQPEEEQDDQKKVRDARGDSDDYGKEENEQKQTEEEVRRQHQGMDRPGVRQVPEGIGEQGKMEKTGCKIICGAPTTLVVKGLMMMMMSAQLWEPHMMDPYLRVDLTSARQAVCPQSRGQFLMFHLRKPSVALAVFEMLLMCMCCLRSDENWMLR